MTGPLAAFLLALAPAAAAAARPAPPSLRTPDGDVARIFAQVERLERAEADKDAADVKALDRRAEALAPEVARWGRRCVAPLLSVARDEKRSLKTRLIAVSVAGLVGDPGAFIPLKRFMDDPRLPDVLRSQAAQDLTGVGVSDSARSRAFCELLDAGTAGPQLRGEALSRAARLGCPDSATLERQALAIGARPAGAQLPLALFSVQGLGRTAGLEAARALWRLHAFYPTGSALRGATLTALDEKRADLAYLPDNEPDALAAFSEAAGTPNAPLAARLVGAVGTRRCQRALERALKDSDAEVLAEAAEALARLKDARALKPLQDVVAGALKDERFAPRPGRADPAKLLARIEAARDALDAAPGRSAAAGARH